MDILASVTDGYFSCKPKKCPDLLSMATSGLLSCFQIEIPTIEETVKGGGNNNTVFRYSYNHEVVLSTRRQLIKEDQEILLIIKSFVHCQD